MRGNKTVLQGWHFVSAVGSLRSWRDIGRKRSVGESEVWANGQRRREGNGGLYYAPQKSSTGAIAAEKFSLSVS